MIRNKRFLRGLTLKQRVFGFMCVLGFIPFACFSLMVYADRDAARVDEISQIASKGALRLSHMNAEIYAVVMDSRGILLSTSKSEIEDFSRSTEAHLKALAAIAEDWKAHAAADDAANLEAVTRNIDGLIAIRSKAIAAARAGDLQQSAGISRSEESVRSRKALNESVQRLSRVYEAKEVEATAQRIKLRKESLNFISGIVILTILFGGFGAYIVHRTVIRLFNRMRVVMTEVAAGNIDAQFEGVERADEIGAFARALALFKENAVARARLAAETDADRSQREAERETTRKIEETRAREQAAAIDGLGQALFRLSQGDLTYRMNERLAAAFQNIQRDFNAAASTLHATMSRISENSSTINAGSAEIRTASDDLSHRTEQQAAGLEQTVAALDHIAQAVARSSSNAANAKKLADVARTGATSGGETVTQAIVAMSKIEGSSGQISQIIGVIDEIAFQTNLLALNGGVEAARAGEAGRGFAVVASEVRALAQRCAEAAKEIKGLIKVASHEVDDGVRLVGQTGDALKAIVQQVTTIYSVIEDIAVSAEEQSNGLREVNVAMNEMDRATQQNAAMVEETTAASHALSSEAEVLAGLMHQFKLEEDEVGHTHLRMTA